MASTYKKEGGKVDKKAKGVKKSVVSRDVGHDDYKDTLLNKRQMRHSMNTIRSDRHQIGSYKITKTSLSCFDDKRYILDDTVSSLAYGHRDICGGIGS